MYVPMYTPFLHHFRLSTYLAPILASLFIFRLHCSLTLPSFRNFFSRFPHPFPTPRQLVVVFISSRVRRVTAKWRKRRQEKHKELGGARKNEGSFFLSMNKGGLIWHVRREDKGSGERALIGAKSKRERLTMGEDAWKEEKVGNRK